MNLNFEIVKDLEKRILVIDGAMGTNIQKFMLKEEDYRGELLKNFKFNQRGNNDLLSITNPKIIDSIHRKFLDVGADIIETNTLNSNKISQKDFGLQHLVYDLNYKSAKLAKKACDDYLKKDGKKRYVAGAVGPTNKIVSLSLDIENSKCGNISFNELKDAYKEQIAALMDGGVDLILIETIFSSLNAKAAIMASNEVFRFKNRNLPIMISGTISNESGKLFSGENFSDFAKSIKDENVISVGLNCSFGSKNLNPFIKELSEIQDFFVSVYPNAGLPDKLGLYEESPEITLKYIEEMLKECYLNIVGGCCGTTYEHIRLISNVSKKYKPRIIRKFSSSNI
ncbi:hypothetical protein UT300007_26070 [Clostridium sp. CTA-7]